MSLPVIASGKARDGVLAASSPAPGRRVLGAEPGARLFSADSAQRLLLRLVSNPLTVIACWLSLVVCLLVR